MKLIVGLGNPEKKYDNTRHNVGFAALDEYARSREVEFKAQNKFKADIAELTVDDEKVLLAKPTTYYNLVGESVRAIADFYKIAPEDILVIHDDFALPLGTIRTRIGGSDAGNNGIKSLNAHLSPDTKRARIGTASELRNQMDDADFVLSKLTIAEKKSIAKLKPAIHQIIDDFLDGDFATTTVTAD